MMARELKPLSETGMRGSSGPLQQRRRISMDYTGSERELIAQITSSELVMSMSLSTTIT